MTDLIRLGELAHARSGDKGNHANIGVVAYNELGYQYLKEQLSNTKVADFFAEFSPTEVERFELPGILALNFLLHNVLAGGASQSLRTDSQGKVLAIALLELGLPRPANLDAMVRQNKA